MNEPGFFGRTLKSFAFGSIAAFAAATGSVVAGPARADATCIKLSDVEIVQLLNRWRTEFASGDPDRVSALYADEASLIATKDGPPHNGKEAIHSYFKDLLAKRPTVSIRPSSLTADCGTAVVSGPVAYRITGERKGTRAVLGGTYMAEYALRDGKWWIVRHSLAADRRSLASPVGDPASTPPL
ncbi:nuclear transport factor 2 family protein [Hyphomicrobium sp. 2TAF46]|uniref:nuclear transport factor 2 family protein n=1 Tax=Hyphomicrobium sp. 2TAF46 TaxID=3233019 RepID=UPI003F9136C4